MGMRLGGKLKSLMIKMISSNLFISVVVQESKIPNSNRVWDFLIKAE